MVIINEKDAPPPYAPVDNHTFAPRTVPRQSKQQLNAQALDVQRQLAALHLHTHQRSPSGSTISPVAGTVPQAPAPAYSPHISSVPPAVMLRIVYACFPEPGSDPSFKRLRRTLFWLAMSLRAVNKSIYIACMHVLRSSYLPAYATQVRQPYTSDPFPYAASGELQYSSAGGDQRETAVLDRWMLLKVRDDVLADESELHLDLDASRDVFDMHQPKARLEDLVRVFGVRHGVVSIQPRNDVKGVYPFAALSVAFETRRVQLLLASRGGRKSALVEVTRTKDETLENTAARIVQYLVKMRAQEY